MTGHAPVEVIACGAIAADVSAAARRRGWPVRVHPLPPTLHNRPDLITGQVAAVAERLEASGARIAVGYADCGTYGHLATWCEQRGVPMLTGGHCYDLVAGEQAIAEISAADPGTYFLTDFLVRSFDRVVIAGLGLDRYPELLGDYFGNYHRVVYLAQQPTDELRERARAAAARLGLAYEELTVGQARLEAALARLIEAA